ncbi:coiled-coil domain-containing protein 80 [Gastrophryne carolinensis]
MTKTFLRFVWAGKPPRIRRHILLLTKEQGGSGLLCMRTYYWAVHIGRVVDWHINSSQKDWVCIEGEIVEGGRLDVLCNLKCCDILAAIKTHPFVGASLEILGLLRRGPKAIASHSGYLTPIRRNPAFPPGKDPSFLGDCKGPSPLRVYHLLDRGTFIDKQKLQITLEREISILSYLQLRHFLLTNDIKVGVKNEPTEFEKACLGMGPESHLLSWAYGMLRQGERREGKPWEGRWEADLGRSLSEEEWGDVYKNAHKGLISSSMQETNYKLITRWYRTPELLHSFFPSVPDTCWRCGQSGASMLHIWWSCQALGDFWKKVREICTQIMGEQLDWNAETVLLGWSPDGKGIAGGAPLARHLLNAARVLIPRNWRSQRSPTVRDWFCQLNHVESMEEICYARQDRLDAYRKIWMTWSLFKDTEMGEEENNVALITKLKNSTSSLTDIITMNCPSSFHLAILLALWVTCTSDRSQGVNTNNKETRRRTISNRQPSGHSNVFRNQSHAVNRDFIKRTLAQTMLKDEAQTASKQSNIQQRPGVRQPLAKMMKDDSATLARSRTARFPSTSNSPNVLASFAGKNRVWIISAPHASDGYYRLMMSLLKNDVYCELAERHIQQIVIFHEEGEEGGKIRRITNEGKILEQPLDPSVVPKMMASLKLEKGKFGMVLLKKTLQVEERYPYPVRLEAMYEVVDQSPIRKIEKLRQKGFVQKCKAAGVEGQVSEEGESSSTSSGTSGSSARVVKPTQASDNVQVTTRREEPKRRIVPTRAPRIKITRKPIIPPTNSPTPKATTLPPPTKATTRIFTTTTRPPTTPPTTLPTTTQKPWTTKVYTTAETPRFQAEVTTRAPAGRHFPVRTDKHRDRQRVQTGKHFATTSRTNKATAHETHTDAPVIITTTTEQEAKENTGRFVDNRTDRKEHSSHDITPGQRKPTKPKTPKKKAVEKILNNEYEDKYDSGKPTTPQVEEVIEEANIPPKKGKEIKKEDKTEKLDKKKKKAEKAEKPPKKEKQAKKDKAEKKVKPEKDRNKKNKKVSKTEDDIYTKPVKKTFTESPRRSLPAFLENFEGKRRLLLITTPKEDNNMYSQQRDEYLEAVCEMAIRKISIITISGTLTNSTMKIDHFQLDNEKPMKVIGDDDLLDHELITELRKEYGMTYNDFFMVLTDLDMRVKQYYEVPIAMKSVFDLVDTFPSRIKEMEKQKRDGITCKREDKTRSLESFLSRFRWRRRLLIISAANDEEWAYQQQLYALNGQACNMGLRHMAILKMVGIGVDGGGVLELYPINGSSSVDREDLSFGLVRDIRNYFQISPEYFSMLLVGKDGNVKSWYPSPMWSMAIVYDLIDSMQLRRQEMAIQQSLGMRCPEDEYGGYGYHAYPHQGYEDGYQDDHRHHDEGYYHRYHD